MKSIKKMHNGAHKLLLIVVNQIIGLPSHSNTNASSSSSENTLWKGSKLVLNNCRGLSRQKPTFLSNAVFKTLKAATALRQPIASVQLLQQSSAFILRSNIVALSSIRTFILSKSQRPPKCPIFPQMLHLINETNRTTVCSSA